MGLCHAFAHVELYEVLSLLFVMMGVRVRVSPFPREFYSSEKHRKLTGFAVYLDYAVPGVGRFLVTVQ